MPLSINALFNIPTREEKFTTKRDAELAEQRKDVYSYLEGLDTTKRKALVDEARGLGTSNLVEGGFAQTPQEAGRMFAGAQSKPVMENWRSALTEEGRTVNAPREGLEQGRSLVSKYLADEAVARGTAEEAADLATERAALRPSRSALGTSKAETELARGAALRSGYNRSMAEDIPAIVRAQEYEPAKLSYDLGALPRQDRLDEARATGAEQDVQQGDINIEALKVLKDPAALKQILDNEIAAGGMKAEQAKILMELYDKSGGDIATLMRLLGRAPTKTEQLQGFRSGLSGSNVIPGSPPASADEAARRLKINIR